MVLVLWDFLAIIPLSTDKLVSHGKLFFCLQPVSRFTSSASVVRSRYRYG